MTDELREATRAPVSQDVEAVARIIAPEAFAVWKSPHDGVLVTALPASREEAMRKAREVIAALTSPEREPMRKAFCMTADPVAPAEPDEPTEAWQTEWPLGMAVEKKSGSSWHGKIVGYYSTALTPQGIAVESDREVGSVQIYPTKAMSQRKAEPDASGDRT